ncbi:hypothetical protein YPPY91_1526 [Yersinia pestis PY-91]|nr:hypothetical protein YPPY89_1592 [Yersinia pestis PY-89]EIT06754.1 hypothetical protein YPPY91_1526 [Yersinia pestis PY-91]
MLPSFYCELWFFECIYYAGIIPGFFTPLACMKAMAAIFHKPFILNCSEIAVR